MDALLEPVLQRAARGREREVLVLTLGHAAGLVADVAEERLVDLEQDRAWRSRSAVDLLVLVAPSLLDLRRLPAHTARLPRGRRIAVLAVLPRDASLRPPVALQPRPQSVRVERGSGTTWLLDVEHLTAVDAAPVVAGLLASSRLGRPAHPGLVVGAAGPDLADWLVGDVAARYVGRAAGPASPAEVGAGALGAGAPGADEPGVDALADEDLVAAAGSGAVGAPTEDGAGAPVAPRAEATVDVGLTTSDALLPYAAVTVRVRRPQDVTWDDLRAAEAAGLGREDLPPLDERSVNPTGFVAATEGSVVRLTWSVAGTGWRVSGGVTQARVGSSDGRISNVDVLRLRPERAVRLDPRAAPGPLVLGRAVVALAAAGVPLLLDEVPSWLAALVGADVAALLQPSGDVVADVLRREEHSVRLRRAALRAHGGWARWARAGAQVGVAPPGAAAAYDVSVVLCSRRPDLVAGGLEQVARQRGVRVECVVGAHGFDPAHGPAAAAIDRARAEHGLDVRAVAVGDDVPFGTALNLAVRATSAPLVAKMDDDDWYGPDHLGDLALAERYADADLLGAAAEFVYLEPLDLTVRRPGRSESFGRNLAGGTLLVRRSVLDEVGGFRPIPRSVDRELIRAVVGSGGVVYRGHGLGFVLRRARTGHTWSSRLGYFVLDDAPQWPGFRPSALLESP